MRGHSGKMVREKSGWVKEKEVVRGYKEVKEISEN